MASIDTYDDILASSLLSVSSAANQKCMLDIIKRYGNNFTICAAHSVCEGVVKGEKWCKSHICLWDLLQLEDALLHAAILSRDIVARQNRPLKSHV